MEPDNKLCSSFNRRRLTHINFLMLEINDCTDNIYESLVDRDLQPLRGSISELRKILAGIEESLKDEG